MLERCEARPALIIEMLLSWFTNSCVPAVKIFCGLGKTPPSANLHRDALCEPLTLRARAFLSSETLSQNGKKSRQRRIGKERVAIRGVVDASCVVVWFLTRFSLLYILSSFSSRHVPTSSLTWFLSITSPPPDIRGYLIH